ncbi:unnamed protein product [Eruca vesicaria subsp. sativa]|uniref:TOD1/MUCI70 glycosyltransferase-like domain-containing protein n=1 Tax=Eruca vesicaria subsp. sativa TaxID=29727 RepID=A0ABC8J6I4_ERUVS|nr:unnamed protein product [Eruca vesicaria subsp. sativa]
MLTPPSPNSRCLKLLPPEELEHLEILYRKDSTSPVKKLLHLTGTDFSSSPVRENGTRFNLFTGNQSFAERERVVFRSRNLVRETVSVHCGVFNENGGFRIEDEDEDKKLMQRCQVVLSTYATLLFGEAKAVVKKHKATPEEVEVQINQYRHDKLPEDKRFNGKKALSEASVIVREHTPLTNLFMCLWFSDVVRYTSRDQLSFPYVFWRLKVLKNVNMFPVCTRAIW